MDLDAARKELETVQKKVAQAEGKMETLKERRDELKQELDAMGVGSIDELVDREKELKKELEQLMSDIGNVESSALDTDDFGDLEI